MKIFYNAMITVVALLISSSAFSATIYSCPVKNKCVVRLEIGKVGDKVKVLDEGARDIAYGRIIKRKGVYGEIALKSVKKKIKRGYPVLIEVNSSDSAHEWAASFSYSKE